MRLEFDTQLQLYDHFKDFLADANQEDKTHGEFLIWLSIELERNRLRSRLLPKK